MELFGRKWTRRDFEARVGRLEQVAGVRKFAHREGPESGVEQIQIRTGAGLSYYVTPSRCLDVGLTEFAGVPVSWQSANGEVDPRAFCSAGTNWLRTAAGGLFMTCGFTQVGSPCNDNGQDLGLHGLAHHLPARQVVAEGRWNNEIYEMRVAGVVEETEIFGQHIRLTREIKSFLGENRILLNDSIQNLAFEPTPFMLLYHFNFGFPLMSEQTQIQFPSKRVLPRESSTPTDGFDSWQSPEPSYKERVYYHEDLELDERGRTKVVVRNPAFPMADGKVAQPLSVILSWDTKTLPRLVQWKMPGAGVHVLGIEPANCYVEGRKVHRERKTLEYLQPGETQEFTLELQVEITKTK
ncbi:MAG: aldose 1-epimerase family protein [Pseudomonadota bacterium]